METHKRLSMDESLKKASSTTVLSATSFNRVRQRFYDLVDRMQRYSGVEHGLVLKLLHYAKMLSNPMTGVIEEHVFKAQMCYRFHISSAIHLQLLYEAVVNNATRKGKIRIEDYVKAMCTFCSPKLDIKINFVFSVYDPLNSGFIKIQQLKLLLKSSVTNLTPLPDLLEDASETERPLKELIDIVLALIDTDKDGFISLEEFREFVKRNPVFVEILGQVMPQENSLKNFCTGLMRTNDAHLVEFFAQERARFMPQSQFLKSSQQKEPYYPVRLDYVSFQ